MSQYYVVITLSVALFYILVEIVGYQFMKTELKEEYLTDKSGILWKTDKNIPYHKLIDVTIVQGPIDRIFGFADIYLQTTGSDGVEAVLRGIKDYAKAQEEIRDRIIQSKNGGDSINS